VNEKNEESESSQGGQSVLLPAEKTRIKIEKHGNKEIFLNNIKTGLQRHIPEEAIQSVFANG
jgi:hypothetical protein